MSGTTSDMCRRCERSGEWFTGFCHHCTTAGYGPGLGEPCGARRAGWEQGPAVGARRLPCVAEAEHEGDHIDAAGKR